MCREMCTFTSGYIQTLAELPAAWTQHFSWLHNLLEHKLMFKTWGFRVDCCWLIRKLSAKGQHLSFFSSLVKCWISQHWPEARTGSQPAVFTTLSSTPLRLWVPSGRHTKSEIVKESSWSVSECKLVEYKHYFWERTLHGCNLWKLWHVLMSPSRPYDPLLNIQAAFTKCVLLHASCI